MKLKKFALAVGIAAALAASASHAVVAPSDGTFVVSPTPQTVFTVYNRTPDTTPWYYELLNPNLFNQLAKVELIDTIPDDQTINYAVYIDANAAVGTVDTSGGTVLTGSFTDAAINPFFTFLMASGGQYVLELSKVGGTSTLASDVSVSAVPLPGAIWLFGSALLGFLGFSNRRKI
jgi:hypothetical protein